MYSTICSGLINIERYPNISTSDSSDYSEEERDEMNNNVWDTSDDKNDSSSDNSVW